MKEMYRNCFFSDEIQPHGRVILVPFKKCLFQFLVSAENDFLEDIFFFMPFSVSEFAGFKNIYLSRYRVSLKKT